MSDHLDTVPPMGPQCRSYRIGHRVHWIQGIHSAEATVVIPVSIVVHANGLVQLRGDSLSFECWNHTPAAIQASLPRNPKNAVVWWKPEWHVLSFSAHAGGVFSLATLDKVEPCVPPIRRRPTETTRQFIERAMRENHGYTVPQRWLADLDAIPDGDTGEPESGYLVGTDAPTTQEKALLRKLAEEFGDGPITANPQEDEG